MLFFFFCRLPETFRRFLQALGISPKPFGASRRLSASRRNLSAPRAGSRVAPKPFGAAPRLSAPCRNLSASREDSRQTAEEICRPAQPFGRPPKVVGAAPQR